MVWCGVVWCGVVWCGVVGLGWADLGVGVGVNVFKLALILTNSHFQISSF